jgi:putative polyhydroxyalkanoate system protein
MPQLVIEEPHSFPRPEAMRRLETAAAHEAAHHKIALQRVGDYALSATAFGVTGRAKCLEDRIRVELDLSLVLWALKGHLEKEVRRELRKVLDQPSPPA